MINNVLKIVELIIVFKLIFFLVKNVEIIEMNKVGVEFLIVIKVVFVIFGFKFKYFVIWLSDVIK